MKNLINVSEQNVNVEVTNVVDSLIEEFLRNADLKPISQDSYRRKLKLFFSWLHGNGIEVPNRETILNYKKHLIGKSNTAYTVSGYLVPVRGLFRYLATVHGYNDPTQNIKGAKRIRGFCRDAFSIEQVKQILRSIDRSTLIGKRDFALLSLIAHTGLRAVEVTRASIEDIRQVGTETVLYVQSKNSETKTDMVVLVEATKMAIADYLQARGTAKPTDALVASVGDGNFGSRLSTRTIRHIYQQHARVSCGIMSPRLTCHSFRHFFVTAAVANGVPLEEVQQAARHSSLTTTQIYLHSTTRSQGIAEKKISEALDSETES